MPKNSLQPELNFGNAETGYRDLAEQRERDFPFMLHCDQGGEVLGVGVLGDAKPLVSFTKVDGPLSECHSRVTQQVVDAQEPRKGSRVSISRLAR